MCYLDCVYKGHCLKNCDECPDRWNCLTGGMDADSPIDESIEPEWHKYWNRRNRIWKNDRGD